MEKVMVECERVNRIPVPAVFEDVPRQVCTCQEQRIKHPIPAVFQTVEDCVQVCEARTEWQRVDCPPAEAACGKSDCFALVTIPPVFEKRCRQVCVQPESCTEEVIPAKYETVTDRVCRQPETCREEIIPARYEDRPKQVEKTCGYYRDETIPAVYEQQSEQICNNDGRWEWKLNTACAVPMPAANNPCNPASTPAPAR
jgi:hypothetical protein